MRKTKKKAMVKQDKIKVDSIVGDTFLYKIIVEPKNQFKKISKKKLNLK